MTRARQNRVTPTGDLVSVSARGLFMGNRGILHDAEGRLGRSRWKHPHWVCCLLSFKGRKRPVMAPGAYTELFFLDEATALAAGHRPCAECRRPAFEAWRDGWEAAFGTRPRAPEIDRALHADRVRRDRSQVRFSAPATSLPTGTFILYDGRPMAVSGDHAVLPYSPDGYGAAERLPTGEVEVLTPRASVAVLRAGYHAEMHPTAAL